MNGAERPTEALVRLDSVGHAFRGGAGRPPLEVLRGVDLAVRAGELVVAAGRSGSGKSTLLNIASGLIPPSAGRVYWSGRLVSGMNEDQRRAERLARFGIVFQSGGLIDTLTAAENVALAAIPRRLSSRARDRALALLADREVADRAGHLPGQLSGGEQQRVALARALFGDPAVLVIDEPTANLDRATATRTIDDLVQLARRGLGILVASHDPELIAAGSTIFQLEPG
jgi:ABC-type lipoprotein export system ATPase subunit